MPLKLTLFPLNSAKGMKKRRVLPLSWQERMSIALARFISTPRTVTVSPLTLQSAPKARRQAMVAKISSLRSMPPIWLVPLDSPAQMSIRCAMLLEEGTVT